MSANMGIWQVSDPSEGVANGPCDDDLWEN